MKMKIFPIVVIGVFLHLGCLNTMSSTTGGGGGAADLAPAATEKAYFDPDVQSVLDRMGCSSSSCHGEEDNAMHVVAISMGGSVEANYAQVLPRTAGGMSSLLLTDPVVGDPAPHEGGKLLATTDPGYLTLQAWIAAGAPFREGAALPATPTPAVADPPAPSALAAFQSSFYAFATTAPANCGQCHSDHPLNGAVPQNPQFAASDLTIAYGNAKPFADFKDPAASVLVTYAGNNHCGAPNCANNTPAALAAVTAWAAAEAAAGLPPPRMPVSDLETLQIVNTDLLAQTPTSQPFQRYFSLEPWGNTGNQPPLVATDMARSALIKMINLLSTGRHIVQPAAVDAGRYVYRVDMRDLNWTAQAWNNMKAIDPYYVPTAFPSTLATAASQTLRADWFIFNIPNGGVNAYFEFLGINSDDPSIDALNNVDRFADMTKGAPATVRAGLPISQPEAHNRIISWHQTTTFGSGALGSGHLFKSYNFDSDVGTSNIFSHPYKPTTNNPDAPGAYDFDYADSDNLFTLPNGLFGYYTVVAPSGTVQQAPDGFPGPTFCLQCHDTKTHLFPVSDKVHDAIAAAPAGTFPSTLKTLLLGMYDTNAINAKITAAGAIFAAAYAALKLPASETAGISTESINIVTNNYSVILTVNVAAAELGVPVSLLLPAIKGSPLALTLSALVTTDASGNPNGVVRRDTWESVYPALRATLFPQLPPQPAP